MTQKMFTVAVDVTVGALTHDISKVVGALITLGLTVKHCRESCKELIEKVESVNGTIVRIEQERNKVKGSLKRFSEDDYNVSLRKFLTVVQDCHALVKRYTTRNFAVRLFLSLKFDEDFISLHNRLDQAMNWFHFDMQVHQTAFGYDNRDDMACVKGQLNDVLEAVKILKEGHVIPEDTQLSNVKVGESLVEGYIIAGQLDGTAGDIMLIATEQGRKEAAILKMISDNDNILRFYGTFTQGPHAYLVMERPGPELRTVYDWIREGHHDGEWRLKNMVALEVAMGLAFAHVAGIIHRNLRSANVFLTDEGHPKIFGFFKGRVKTQPSDKKWTDIEQLRWTAPEMLKRPRPEYNEKCDIFSLGVIMWELITGDAPFSECASVMQLTKERVARKSRLHFQGHQSHIRFLVDFQQISLDCMDDNPEQRPSIDDIVSRLSLLVPEEMCELMAPASTSTCG